MRIEHIGCQVEDPRAAVQWYCEHLGLRVVRKMDESPWTHFLVDDSGRMMLEVYRNPAVSVPDYASMDPLLLHVAFAVDDVPQVRSRLLAAGAKPEEDVVTTASGDQIAILRDPWGFAIQLVKRARPMA